MGVRGIIITSGRGTISRYYTVPRLVHIKMGNFRAFRASWCWFLCVSSVRLGRKFLIIHEFVPAAGTSYSSCYYSVCLDILLHFIVWIKPNISDVAPHWAI